MMAEVLGAVSITADELEMAYGEQIILDKATLTIHEGERVGLVGRNGCGKSTFMKLLCGEEVADGGNVNRKKGLRIGYLPQEFTLDENVNVYDNILQGVEHITSMIAEYESLPHDSNKAHDLEEAITHCDGWSLDYKIETVMTALKAPDKDSAITNLSGGEKRRVALAKALISEPDLIILDEPTNHLDTESIEWLEGYMNSYNGACLFVTHDRYFLDRISSRIVELNRGVFQSYKGNYSNYLIAKAEQSEREGVSEHKRQRFLKKELEWVRRSPKARSTKSQSRVDRFNDVASQSAPEADLNVDLIIPPAARLGNRVVDLVDTSMSFGDKVLFKNLNLEFQPGAKIGIVGPNGVGKSTLIKLILGQLNPVEGKVEISQNTKFNYIDQERLTLNDDNTVVEEIGEGYDFIMLGEERISIWGYLKRFMFSDERIRTKVGRLSGGERARLLLAKVLKRGGNFIVLDEPTNDLDLSTLRLLEDALVGFGGCVLLVSHDRYFLNRVCTGILAFEDNSVEYSVGNYDYYMAKQAELRAAKVEEQKIKNDTRKRDNNSGRKLKWKEEQELDSIEDKIMTLEDKIEAAQAHFMNPDFFKEPADVVRVAQEKVDALEVKKNVMYARWEELEAIKNGEV